MTSMMLSRMPGVMRLLQRLYHWMAKDSKFTAGLEQAIRHRQLPNEERTLWIDTICIDQSDIPERSKQV